MEIKEILRQYKENKLDEEETLKLLKSATFEDLGFAKIDHDRKERTGSSEVIYGENKSKEQLTKIFLNLYEKNGEVLATRVNEEQFNYVKNYLPKVSYDKNSHILKISKEKKKVGKIIILSAGTADSNVANEAYEVADFLGSYVEKIYDVGVSGIHRLLAFEKEIKSANVIICVAGMEGALASVVAGLVKVPVIACPTSVGYGSSFHGLSALLTMLNSCANGVSVVNIDNGFGAAYIAHQINLLAVK